MQSKCFFFSSSYYNNNEMLKKYCVAAGPLLYTNRLYKLKNIYKQKKKNYFLFRTNQVGNIMTIKMVHSDFRRTRYKKVSEKNRETTTTTTEKKVVAPGTRHKKEV